MRTQSVRERTRRRKRPRGRRSRSVKMRRRSPLRTKSECVSRVKDPKGVALVSSYQIKSRDSKPRRFTLLKLEQFPNISLRHMTKARKRYFTKVEHSPSCMPQFREDCYKDRKKTHVFCPRSRAVDGAKVLLKDEKGEWQHKELEGEGMRDLPCATHGTFIFGDPKGRLFSLLTKNAESTKVFGGRFEAKRTHRMAQKLKAFGGSYLKNNVLVMGKYVHFEAKIVPKLDLLCPCAEDCRESQCACKTKRVTKKRAPTFLTTFVERLYFPWIGGVETLDDESDERTWYNENARTGDELFIPKAVWEKLAERRRSEASTRKETTRSSGRATGFSSQRQYGKTRTA